MRRAIRRTGWMLAVVAVAWTGVAEDAVVIVDQTGATVPIPQPVERLASHRSCLVRHSH